MKKIFLLMLVLVMLNNVLAIDSERQERLDFGYVLNIKSIITEPLNLVPGQEGIVKVVLENNAKFPLYDIRAELTLPDEISFYEDISKRKLAKMESGETNELVYRVLVVPGTTEGIYDSSFKISYLNHVATERQENDSFGILVKSVPKIFVEVEESNIYKDKSIGRVTLNFVNYDISDIKFLTIELAQSEDYEILSPNKKYIGDLDSDDFESVDFDLRVYNSKEELKLPVKIKYKDRFNKDYLDEVTLNLKIRSEAELNNKTNPYVTYIVLAVIVLILGLVIFNIRRKKKRKE